MASTRQADLAAGRMLLHLLRFTTACLGLVMLIWVGLTSIVRQQISLVQLPLHCLVRHSLHTLLTQSKRLRYIAPMPAADGLHNPACMSKQTPMLAAQQDSALCPLCAGSGGGPAYPVRPLCLLSSIELLNL